MRAVVGIGNPGKKYQFNRHNVGFLALDHFAEKQKIRFIPSKYDYYFTEGEVEGNPFILAKPTTYVNNSGIAVKDLISSYNIPVQDVLIVVDDINLNEFDFRLKKSGSDGGHNGLASIIYSLNTDAFPRLRIGIGSDFEKGNLAEYVLSDFDETELKKLYETFEYTSAIIRAFIVGGYNSCLSEYSKIKNQLKNNLKDSNGS
ncbi:MAG: aminoacyl-tRNA hydrolase [Ignavibacterium sp.]|uniref:aminoacyl-tRNA hydrolase n=1 Tax=Ignavibacterium sp. TaxID=2651167 RepID=UPI003298E0BB